jgi:hypothetical protein
MRLGKALATGIAEETGQEPAAAQQQSEDTVMADAPRPPDAQEQPAAPRAARTGRTATGAPAGR